MQELHLHRCWEEEQGNQLAIHPKIIAKHVEAAALLPLYM